MPSACRQLELPNSSLSNSTSHQAAGSKTTSTAPLTPEHLTSPLPGGLFEVFLSNCIMSNTFSMNTSEFNQLAADIEQAKSPSASELDRAWLEFHQLAAIAYGLHPDAICASDLNN
jgi:hypothetical protein